MKIPAGGRIPVASAATSSAPPLVSPVIEALAEGGHSR